MRVAGNAAAPVGSLRLLPLFLGVLVVALVFRVGDFAGDVGKVVTAARAQEAADPVPPADRHEADAAASEAGPETDAPAPEATDTTELPLAGISRAEMSLLQDLRARRQELEDRERKVALQEQLLATTERRIDQRIAEMQKIEKRIAELVAQHDAREEEQLKSVVSMYEKMKPKDAAPIFERLDIDIQLAVATRMKDSKMAALLAQMDPEAAKTLTTRLATREELPEAAQILAEQSTP